MGTCDFLLAEGPQVPFLRAPVLAIVEAKRADVELGLGQCVAQMLAAQVFNQKKERPPGPTFGCVTTGEDWQFLRLDGTVATFDPVQLFLGNLNRVLGAFLACLAAVSPDQSS